MPSDSPGKSVLMVEECAKEGAETVVICTKIEEEIAQLDDSEKKEFLSNSALPNQGLISLCSRLFLRTDEFHRRA